ncbi:class I adenylate-forming enzyme family protein [Sphingomonas bacterium]|uniref:class I adenylate-forming enzyme family protein n=1 Tax=Sphingomonas bacterium TaxID=1895847 RepID=UPI0015754E7E|nr:class I adenylate-forming enzyme family protein [Sphingomonas bacterium]
MAAQAEALAQDSLGWRVLGHARNHPERRAVVCDGAASTYREMAGLALRCASRLRNMGLVGGGNTRVGLLANNSLDFAAAALACQLAGVALVPLPALVTPDALGRMIDDAGVVLLFHDRDHDRQALIATAQASANVQLVPIGGAEPTLERWCRSTEPLDAKSIDPSWTSDLIYSSGTTGTPKGIAQSFGSRGAQCVSLAPLGVGPDTNLLHTISMYSNFGLSALLLSLWWGGTFFMLRKFSGAAVVDILAGERIDMAWFAPATLVRTVEAPGFADAVRGHPCIKLCAGAPLSDTQKRQVVEGWDGPFFDVYGQTETGTLTMLPMHAAPSDKWKSVGTVLPSVQVRILDDDDNVLPPGAEGEIAGHSTTLMAGYHARDEANASAHWRDEAGRLYVRTGDVGRIDEDGYLWLCDRKKDMIISGGYNIYPADIERVLSDHPAVFEAAVVGCASHRWGETPVAFLTLREGASADEEELRAWVNARVGTMQRVAAVRILAALPNGTMGKILKRTLRDEHAASLGTLP